MTSPFVERRLLRSSNPKEALASWLEAIRRRKNLRSLALADDLGMLVAGAGISRECDELAAWAPLLFGEGAATERPEFELSGMRVPGIAAYVCASGSAEPNTLSDVAAGCSRILSAS
jgi:hypothetical protein